MTSGLRKTLCREQPSSGHETPSVLLSPRGLMTSVRPTASMRSLCKALAPFCIRYSPPVPFLLICSLCKRSCLVSTLQLSTSDTKQGFPNWRFNLAKCGKLYPPLPPLLVASYQHRPHQEEGGVLILTSLICIQGTKCSS